MGKRHYYVYILASKIGGTLYIGVTNDLIRRVAEHKSKVIESFTEKYDVARLVYFEQFDDPENAIKREKRLKSGLEGSVDRAAQSELGRPVSRDRRATMTPSCLATLSCPAKAGHPVRRGSRY